MAFSLSGSLSKGKRVSPEVRSHSEEILSKCKEGDLLEFPREGYSHWAVYVGGEKVIHLSGNSDTVMNALDNSPAMESLLTFCGVLSDMGKVMEASFWDVVGDSWVKINNYLDTDEFVVSGKEILARAQSRLGKVGYNALWKNCEHFATWCRYGESKSQQATTALVAGIGVAGIAAGLGYLWLSSRSGKKE